MKPKAAAATATDPQRIIAGLRRQLAKRDAELAAKTAALDAALTQQEASTEILQIINSSPGDLKPVFDAALEKAIRLCDAACGFLWMYDGECFSAVAMRGVEPAFAEVLRGRNRPHPRTGIGRILVGEPLVQMADIMAEAPYQEGDPAHRASVKLGNIRTALVVPMHSSGRLLGGFTIFRQEVRPFTEQQIALLQNFAAQAVIAMENARLLNETREALEQQTATAEVLQVINSSPGDLKPVFDAMLEKALRLCTAKLGFLSTFDGQLFDAVATLGVSEAYAAQYFAKPYAAAPGTTHDLLVRGEDVVHIPDLAADPLDSPRRRAVIEMLGVRTILGIALRKEGRLVGALHVYRQEVRPFSEKEIALLQNFAAQAVIAMENARLLNETREALEQQTATAEVLQVINASPGDLAPVFDAMLEKAVRLCEAVQGVLWTLDGMQARVVAAHQMAPAFIDVLRKIESGELGPPPQLVQIMQGERVVLVDDVAAEQLYLAGHPLAQAAVELGRVRTLVWIALVKDNLPVGAFAIARREVRPFSEKQIALLQNFAAQAVIAMENARLLGELRRRTRDLQESLDYQTATSEVLQVISRSAFDLDAVLQTVVSSAVRLCRGQYGVIFRNHDGEYRYAAGFGASPEYEESERRAVIRPGRGTIVGRAALEGRAVQIEDALSDADYEGKAEAAALNARTMLGVPLLREGQVIGAFGLARNRVEPFSDREVELVTTFADQAAIAIENARLLGELRARTADLQEALDYQTATSDVLKVISRSTFDLRPVLDTLCETAARLCGAEMGMVARREGDLYRAASTFAFTPEWATAVKEIVFEPGHGSVVGRAALARQVVQVEDLAADPDYALPGVIAIGKMRTAVGVPLLRGAEPMGVLYLARQRVEPFSERQIELVRTFADQAVIAIENTRLLTELRESLEQQQAMAEVLGVINANPGNLQPVFDAILEKAHSLCGVAMGSLELYDGEHFTAVAVRGLPEAFADMLRGGTPALPNPATRALVEGAPLTHIRDLAETEFTLTRNAADLAFARTLLCVPLRREKTLLGMIACARSEVRSFSEKEIGLLQSFAAQAVIAMDNARLLDEIRRRQAELRVTFDNMGDGVAMFDANLKLAAWNRNFQTLLDLPDEFLAVPRTFEDYIRLLAGRGELGDIDIDAQIGDYLERSRRANAFERERPDGHIIEVRHNPVPGGGFVLIYGDVTERKRAEAEIRAARDDAERALGELRATQQQLILQQKMAALGQLTAGIAHEIRNPLNFINNFAGLSNELLAELQEAAAPAVAALDDDARADIGETFDMLSGNLDKIAEHGRRADGIVQSMLLHSRGGTGDRRAVDLNALIDEALNLAYHGARAQDQNFNITLERDFDAALAPLEVVPQDVTRVFLNLFGNGFYAATKKAKAANGAFRPALRVATRDLGDAVEVAVRDNGTGIAPEIRDRLFQPFVTTKPTGEGTGLGLSISYDIVTQQHGGTIAVASEPGEFTEFTVRLPRAA